MADPDISDYECDADDLLLMPIIFPPTNGYDQCLDKWIEKKQSVSIFFLQKNWTAVQKTHFINNKQTLEFQENIASFSSV